MKPADETSETVPAHEANPGFALGQLAAALATGESAADPSLRARAAEKARKWLGVLQGMLSGTLHVGSRTPLPDTPAWATPEVLHGGFVSGALLAGGPLRPHEAALLARLGSEGGEPPRARLNRHSLEDEEFPGLLEMLESGRYRVEVPEEGALLVAAWLLSRGRADAAQAVLAEVAPHFPALRFYPVPHARPLPGGEHVHLRTAGEIAAELRQVRAPQRVLEQREALLVWAPLADRVTELFLETVDGPAPTLATGPDGKALRDESGRHTITGGWPCRHFPAGWQGRALAVLEDYRRLRQEHRRSARPDRPRETFAQLRRYLEVCAADPARLTGRDVGMIRLVLAGIVTRRGAPGSERLRSLRQAQARNAARPTRAELAGVVAERLRAHPGDAGVEAVRAVVGPVTADEAARHGVPEGEPLAPRFSHRVRRCMSAPVEELVREGIITSGESLARVVPALTAQVRAAGMPDDALRRLYGAVYQAFRRRRSLLLFDLQSQVKFEELPWVRAMDAQRSADAPDPAQRELERVAVLALTSFPQQILPNKLVRELRALSNGVEPWLPFVDELAADIFMDAFTGNYLWAAQAAGHLLGGTLYERYYEIPYAQIRSTDDVERASEYGPPVSRAFLALCVERAGPDGGASWVARNGAILEQAQILTTHNLAVLCALPGVRDALPAEALARRCFAWICRSLAMPVPGWKARLQMVKNAAYAWRQMIFFLSLLPEDSARAFLTWAAEHLGKQREDVQARFGPALRGFARALDGLSPESPADDARRFLGWTTTGTHWLLEPPVRKVA